MAAQNDEGDAEQPALLRADALPARDGGGIVFPDGFLGSAFRLGPEDFTRYRAGEDAARAGGSAAGVSWSAVWLSLLCLLASATVFWVVGGGLALFERPSKFLPYRPDVLATAVVLAFALLYFYVAWRLIRSPERMARRFPAAEPLAPFAFWRTHVLAAVIARPGSWAYRYPPVFVLTLLPLYYAWRLQDQVPEGWVLTAAFGLIALAATVWSASFLLTAQQLGRAPRLEDLQAAVASEEAAAAPQETAPQVAALPAQDGGAVVYPSGLDGFGYRLNASDFARYTASLNPTKPQEATALNRMVGFLVMALFLAGLVGFGWGAMKLQDYGLLTQNGFITGLFLLLFALKAPHIRQAFVREPKRMRDRFPGAQKLPYTAFWRQRVLAVIMTQESWKSTYLERPLLLGCLLLFWIYRDWNDGEIELYAVVLASAYLLSNILDRKSVV